MLGSPYLRILNMAILHSSVIDYNICSTCTIKFLHGFICSVHLLAMLVKTAIVIQTTNQS